MASKKAVPRRYAQAIFLLAQEKNCLNELEEDLDVSLSVCQDEVFRRFLWNAKVSTEDKGIVVKKVLSEVGSIVQNLVCLLAARGLIGFLPGIEVEYRQILDNHFNRKRALVTSAIPMASHQKDKVIEVLSKMEGKEIILDSVVDSGIIGGMVIRIGDTVIDGSARNRLEQMHKALKGNSARLAL